MPSATFFNLPPAKREKLLAAARAEFVRAPFAQASVNRIIHGAGIPRGSFYMYFADKEELFRYLMEDFGTQLIRQMERLLEERNGAVFAAFLDLFDYVQDRRAEYRDLLNILRRNGDMRPGLFPGRMPGGLPRRACGSGWTSRGWTCGRRATWKPSSTSSFSSPEAP